MATTEGRPGVESGTDEWRRELYDAARERQGELFSTVSGLENEPLYTPDTVEIDYERDLGYPGVYPFTRGVYPSMYRGRLWTMRQFAGFGTAEETNERFRYLLEHGQTGLSTAFDMPTLMGYDSDHPRSLGEVGREGVAVDTLADMEDLFRGIPLDQVTTSMTVNIARTAIEALAAVLGGTQSLHTNSFDEALALPTEEAARLALRTQQVILHETGLAHSADPLGGSWLVESLTDELERQAYDYFEQIERLGGVVAALEQNFFQREI